MARSRRSVFIVGTIDDGESASAVRVAHTPGGRGVGTVDLPDDDDLRRAIHDQPVVYGSIPLEISSRADDRGRLVDTRYVGFASADGEEKLASDPLGDATAEWRASKFRKNKLPKVLEELRKVVAGRAGDFSAHGGPEVPQAEFMKSGLKALKKFDPKRGVKASTFVTGSLKEANRPLLRRATILRVPEARLQKVGPVRRATRELEDALGRPPTVQEIAKHAKVSPKVVKLLQREVSPIHIVSKEQVRKGDIGTHVKEMWDLLGPELEGTEKKVYELLSADPKATNTQIAKKIRVTPSQVSRYRQRLRRRVLADN